IRDLTVTGVQTCALPISRLRHLPADHVPRFSAKRLLLKRGDITWCEEATQEGEEPFAAAVVPEAIDLREVQRQIIRQETVQNLRDRKSTRLNSSHSQISY